MRRKSTINRWLLVPIFITLVFCGSFLLRQNHSAKNFENTSPGTTPQSHYSLAPIRHVTKSLAELGKMDEINKHVLFFNTIPNSGSEVLIFLLQKIQGFNGFKHVRLKSLGDPVLNSIQEEELVSEIYSELRKAAIPMSFDRNVHFVNFSMYDKQSPTFINLIREPGDKLLSRSTHTTKKYREIIKCLKGERESECQKYKTSILQVPYFCGHDSRCGEINNKWALQMAKSNVERYYPVVGVLEEFNATLEILEEKSAYFFKNVQTLYKENIMDKFNHKKRTKIKKNIKGSFLKSILRQEYDFYDWIKMRLFQQLQVLYGEHQVNH